MKKAALALIIIFKTMLCYAQEPRLVMPIGHTGDVISATFSPDGSKLLTASFDNTIKLWDAKTGFLLLDIQACDKDLKTAAFSDDGKMILTVAENSAKLWDAFTGKLVREFTHANSIYNASLSADGLFVATSGKEGDVTVWVAGTGQVIYTLRHKSLMVLQANFSASGRKILAVSMDSTLDFDNPETGSIAEIWDMATGNLVTYIKGKTDDWDEAEFSPDEASVLLSSKTPQVYDAFTGKLRLELRGHSEKAYARYSPDGSMIVTVGEDSTLKVWNAITGKMLLSHRLAGRSRNVMFDPSGKHIVFGTMNGELAMLDIATKKIAWRATPGKWVRAVSFNNDGDEVAIGLGNNGNAAYTYDVATGRLAASFKGRTPTLSFSKYNKDGSMCLTASWDDAGTFRLWNTANGQLAHFAKTGARIDAAAFNPAGASVIIASEKQWQVWNLQPFALAYTQTEDDEIKHASFSADGSTIRIATEKGLQFFDAATKKLTLYRNIKMDGLDADISPDNTKLLLYHTMENPKVIDITSGDVLAELKTNTWIFGGEFDPSGKYVATALIGSPVKIFDAVTGTLVSQLPDVTMKSALATFNGDGKKIIAHMNDGLIICNVATGEAIQYLDQPAGIGAHYVSFARGDNRLLSSSSGNTSTTWDLNTGKPLYTFFGIDSTDFMMYLPGKYFQATRNAAKLLYYVTGDLKVITFDQLDIKYNRPDKVQQAVGNPDTSMVNAYRHAYQKRIRRLGIDTLQFSGGYSVPTAEFTNRASMPFQQTKQEIMLRIHASDETIPLQRLNVWVNEVPLFGIKGISLAANGSRIADTTLVVKLSPGENRIETSVTNVNGIESYRIPLFLQYQSPSAVKEKLHFIGIGINHFANASYNLKWSINDIRKLAEKFKGKYPGMIIDTLFDGEVTKANILSLKQKLLELDEDDKVIISYSGHGLLSKDLDYYLSTYDINFDKPEENGLAYDELESLMDGIKPRKKLMLIDACHSGEVDKEEIERIEAATKALDSLGTNRDTTNRSSIVIRKTKLGAANSFELMQNLFVNVSRGTGATVISAAGGLQYAQERGELQNGVFTYSILDAFNKNITLTVSQLKKIVGESVVRLTNGLQRPTSRNETGYDWAVW
jgi:WD40 repeat protein